jgi:hypothetical protein
LAEARSWSSEAEEVEEARSWSVVEEEEEMHPGQIPHRRR